MKCSLKSVLVMSGFGLTALCSGAIAQTSGDVNFSGDVVFGCSLTVTDATGTLEKEVGAEQISSIQSGDGGEVSVQANGDVRLDASATLDASPGNPDSLAVSGTLGDGVSTSVSIDAASAEFGSLVSVHMAVGADGVLAAGNYSGTVTVTCSEPNPPLDVID